MGDAKEYLIDHARRFKPFIFEFFIKSSTENIIELFSIAHRKGAKIWVNPVSQKVGHGFYENRKNPESCWEYIIEQGASILNTNKPELMLRFLRSKSLHI